MSKAILVLPEMPESCEKCRLRDKDDSGGSSACVATGYIILRKVGEKKPDFCQLRPMPEKEKIEEACYSTFENGYRAGWNKAIETIEGNGE